MSVWNQKCLFSPSLITLDMCNLESQVRELESCNIPMLHIDILDGHFSPSMPLGLETVRQLKKITRIPFDVHVMVTNPDYFIDELLDIGVEQIVFHAETTDHLDGMISTIHNSGVRAGIALKPATPLCTIEYVVEKCDVILLMLINPGYASSKAEDQVIYADRKIRELHKIIKNQNLSTKISIDGRISLDDIRSYGSNLVDIFVAGSTCIDRTNISGSTKKLFDIRKSLI